MSKPFSGIQTPSWYWLSAGAFLLALLAKTSVVMLPFVLLGCAAWKRRKIGLRDWAAAAPFFLLSLILGVVTIWAQYHRAIASDVVQTAGFWERLARAGWAVWFYLYKAVLPINLSFVYERWTVNPALPWVYLPGTALLGCLAVFWKFRRSWGGPLLFGLGYFTVTLFPVLGFFDIYFQKYSFVADHWQYTSLPGVVALAAGAAAYWGRRSSWLMPAGIGMAVLLGWLTWKQCGIYKDSETLWRDTIRKNPKAAIARQNLGAELMEKGRLQEAMSEFRAALEAQPDHAGAHYSLASCLAVAGRTDEALPHLRRAVEIKPDFDAALNTLAWVLATHPDPMLRNGPQAVRHARLASELAEGGNAGYLDTLAAAYAEAGKFSLAVKTAERAVETALRNGEKDMAADLEVRLQRYKMRRPWREHP